MNSGNTQPANTGRPDRVFIVSGEEINRIVVPLTVVHTYVQLLRRRIRKDRMSGRDGLDQALAHMEGATTAMVTEIQAMTDATSYPTRGRDAE